MLMLYSGVYHLNFIYIFRHMLRFVLINPHISQHNANCVIFL